MNVDLQKRLAKLQPGKKLEKWEREKLEVDWGTIPGNNKPFLKQPGAEKFMFWTHLRPKYSTREVEIGDGHFEVVNRVVLIHKKSKEEVFEGPECSCSTMEDNYRYRWIERAGNEPQPSKEEVAAAKSSGRGKWKKEWITGENNQRVQTWVWYDRFDNPNVYNERNKVRQMSAKRGVVKCIRNAGAMSEIFTEDPGEWDLPEDPDAIDVSSVVYDPKPAGRVKMEPTEKTAQPQAPQPTTAPKAGNGVPAGGGRPQAQAPAPQAAPPAKKKVVTVSWSQDNTDAVITGEIAELLDAIKAAKGQWLDHLKAWVIAAPYVSEFWEYVSKLSNYQIQELKPLARPEPPVKPLPAIAVIQKVRAVKDKGKLKYLEVLWAGNVWHTCFLPNLFDAIGQGVGQEAEFTVEPGKPPKITAIKRIGKTQFEDNEPTLNKDREPGRTLF